MTDYRGFIAPFINSLRTERTTDGTIRKYTKQISDSIDFLMSGNYEPDEEYYSALETHLSASNLAKSTTDDRVSLVRRFFTWILTQQGQQGDTQPHMIDTYDEAQDNSNEEASKTQLDPAVEVDENEQPVPSLAPAPVDAEKGEESAEQHITPPQDEKLSAADHCPESSLAPAIGRPRKSPEGRGRKLTIYLTPTLEADIKDLARIQHQSTPDFIFRLIERETERRADALAAFRALEEKD